MTEAPPAKGAVAVLEGAIAQLRSLKQDGTTDGAQVTKLYNELGVLVGVADQRGAHRVNGKRKHNGFGEASVVAAVQALRRGELILVSDDEDRENEGDLIMAAEFATAETIAFMVKHTSGLVCVSMPPDRVDELRLPPMVTDNEDPKGTAFTVSVDAKKGTTTGISAGDRAETLRQLADPSSTAEAFNRPGHLFPLRCREGGVLTRRGHTEATVDLMRLAGLQPCGALCEVVSSDGLTMARMPELLEFAGVHNLVFTTIEDLASYRREHDVDGAIVPISQ